MDTPKHFAAFAANNPARVLWELLNSDQASLEALAARLGGKAELDDDSFLRAALALEPPKGTT